MSPALELGLAAALLAWASLVTIVSVVAMVRALVSTTRGLRGRAAALAIQAPLPRVVVVRPCAGAEPHLRRSLESTGSLRYPGPLRVVLSTSTADDAARPVLLETAASLRARGMDVTVAVVAPRGVNLKASQLAGLLDTADDEVALVVDSDVDLEGLEVARLVAALHDPTSRVAAVWCPPVEREPVSLGDRMSAALLGGSLHAFALLGRLDPHGLVGKTFAVRLAALRAVGGFGGLVQHLGEDMELARRLRERGWGITMSSTVVASLASRRSARHVLARYARWLMVIRAQRPGLLWSYPLLLAGTPGLLACGSIAASLGLPGAGFAMLVVGVTRLSVAFVAARIARRPFSPGQGLVDVMLADFVLLGAFVRALGPTRVRWRDRSLRIGRDGVLEPSPSERQVGALHPPGSHYGPLA